MFSRFGTIPACDGRMDEQTHDASIYRGSIASRGKKVCEPYTRAFQSSDGPGTCRDVNKAAWHKAKANAKARSRDDGLQSQSQK